MIMDWVLLLLEEPYLGLLVHRSSARHRDTEISKTQSLALLRSSVTTCTSHVIPLICGYSAPSVIKTAKFGTWIRADKNLNITVHDGLHQNKISVLYFFPENCSGVPTCSIFTAL